MLNLFGTGASRYRGNQAGALRKLEPLGDQYGGIAQGYGGIVQDALPQFRGQFASSVASLRRNPYDTTRRGMELSRADSGRSNAWEEAAAALRADMARRGMASSGVGAGAMASLLGRRAVDQGMAHQQVAFRGIEDEDSRRRELQDYLAQALGIGTQGQMGAMGAQGSIYGGAASGWGDMASAEEQRKAAAKQMLAQALGAAGSAYGSYMGGGRR